MPKGFRGFQKKVKIEEMQEEVSVVASEPVKTCFKCNEWLLMGVCTRTGEKRSGATPWCEAKQSGK
jgi:hypothetical protein